jgi:site-specific DNA recombinase
MDKRAVIYTRVSDPSQIDNNSLETQEQVCRKFANLKGFEVAKVFIEEGKSAKHTESRPELKETLAYCSNNANNISALIVYKFDRFSRNTFDGLAVIALLAKSKVEVISATEVSDMNPMGKAIRTVLMAFGELDNEIKGERVKDNMQAVFRKGLWPFKTPIGYKRRFRSKEDNKGLSPIPDPNLAPIVTRMFEKAATGIYNKSQLARLMNLEGFGDHFRAKASHKIVHKILSKTFYYGLMQASKWNESVIGQHEPLIDEGTWTKAYQHVILKKKNYSYHDTEFYPLKGSLLCDLCKHPMTTSPSKGKTKIVYYYECKNKGCSKLRINIEQAHTKFSELLEQIQPSQRVIKLFNDMVFSEWDKVLITGKEQEKLIQNNVITMKKELASIRKAKDEGIYTPEEAKEEADRLRRDIVVLEIELSEIKFEQFDSEIVREFVEHFLFNLELLWERLDLVKKQAFLKKVFVDGIVCTEDKEIRTLNLSPSFELIRALNDNDDRIVTPWRIELQLPG